MRDCDDDDDDDDDVCFWRRESNLHAACISASTQRLLWTASPKCGRRSDGSWPLYPAFNFQPLFNGWNVLQ